VTFELSKEAKLRLVDRHSAEKYACERPLSPEFEFSRNCAAGAADSVTCEDSLRLPSF
jgi:hypothetical protein